MSVSSRRSERVVGFQTVQRLMCRTEGASAAEYAVMLGLMLVMLGAVATVGTMTGALWRDAAPRLFSKDTHEPANALSVVETGALASAGEPVAETHRDSYFAAFIFAFSALALIVTLVVTHRRNRRNEAEPEEEITPVCFERVAPDHVFAKRQAILQLLSGDRRIFLENRLEVRHLMSRRLVCTRPEADVDQVRQTMREKKLRHMLVCTGDGQLVGIISDRDLKKPDARRAAEMMTPNPITVAPDTPINPAITTMMQRRISCLPVVEGGKLCGVLTTTDLLMTLQCSLQLLSRIATEIKRDGGEPAGADNCSSPADNQLQPTA